MLSFIIIGRNEAANLERCIRSVLSTLVHWNISAYEIIYVDSRSTDRSIEIVKQFPRIKIFYVTGECSAAISRNIGAAEAIGTTLFFVDADMELISTFMDGVFNIDGSLKYDVITGQVVDVVDKKLTVRRHLGGTRFLSCGVFLIKKSVWQKVSGMRTKYKAGEDPDLGLRLSKKGASFHFKNEPIVKHYTIHYHDRRRVWKRLGDKSSFYYRCVLYRDHVLNSNMYRLLYSYDKTFLLFIVAIGFVTFRVFRTVND